MIRKVAATAAVVVLLGAAYLAMASFHDGPVRCGAPLLGAEVEATTGDLPDDTVVLPGCGDEGVRRVVYATGLFLLGMTAVLTLALSGDRRAAAPAAPAASPPAGGETPAPPSDA